MVFISKRHIQLLKEKLAITPAERNIILFLIVSLLIGDTILYFEKSRAPEIKKTQIESNKILKRSFQDTVETRAGKIQKKINLNKATFKELLSLPGIGPVKAKRIIEMRKKLKGFKSWDDLLKVKGIGPKTLERLKKVCVIH